MAQASDELFSVVDNDRTAFGVLCADVVEETDAAEQDVVVFRLDDHASLDGFGDFWGVFYHDFRFVKGHIVQEAEQICQHVHVILGFGWSLSQDATN